MMITGVEYMAIVACGSLAASFVLLLLTRLGMVEWLQVHGCGLLSELARCGFCLSFWTNMAVFAAVSAYTGDWLLLSAAPLATPLTRMMT